MTIDLWDSPVINITIGKMATLGNGLNIPCRVITNEANVLLFVAIDATTIEKNMLIEKPWTMLSTELKITEKKFQFSEE